MKQYGVLKSGKRFKLPTRGGNTSFLNREKEKPLTGQVQGIKATEGEERFANVLNKSITKGLIRNYTFRFTTLSRRTTHYKELDFLVITNNQPVAISVQGTSFVHRSSSSKNQDLINDLIILSKLRELGFNIPKITNVSADDLETPQKAEKIGRQLGLYR